MFVLYCLHKVKMCYISYVIELWRYIWIGPEACISHCPLHPVVSSLLGSLQHPLCIFWCWIGPCFPPIWEYFKKFMENWEAHAHFPWTLWGLLWQWVACNNRLTFFSYNRLLYNNENFCLSPSNYLTMNSMGWWWRTWVLELASQGLNSSSVDPVWPLWPMSKLLHLIVVMHI